MANLRIDGVGSPLSLTNTHPPMHSTGEAVSLHSVIKSVIMTALE